MDLTYKYKLMCEKAEDLQRDWEPKIGDYILRKYSIFNKKLDKEIWSEDKLTEIIILNYKSSVDNYFHAVNSNGEERLFNTRDYYKTTSTWLPRQDQLQKLIIIKENYHGSFLYQHFELIDEMVFKAYEDKHINLQSYEQVWLCLVLYLNYNKYWNGTEWLTTKERITETNEETKS